jgi:hypothetical protein
VGDWSRPLLGEIDYSWNWVFFFGDTGSCKFGDLEAALGGSSVQGLSSITLLLSSMTENL